MKKSKISDGLNDGLNENQLFEFIKENPGLNNNQFTTKFKVSSRTIERWVSKLKRENKIEFRGSKKTGGYYPLQWK